jgi:hypothetical protein
MVMSREVAPALYVARALGMLPFSHLDHKTSPYVRSSSLIPRVLTIIVHVITLALYFHRTYNTMYTLLNVLDTYESSERLSATSSLATSFIGLILDLANIMNALVLINYTFMTVGNILVSLKQCDELLCTNVSTKQRNAFISVLIVVKYILKLGAFFVFIYNSNPDLRFSTQMSAFLFLGPELLLLVLCLELRDRLRIINRRLSGKRRRFTNLTVAYDNLFSIQETLNRTFGPFLCLHLSQLFLLVLKVLVVIAISCVFHVNVPYVPLKNDKQCFAYLLQLLDGLIRFSLVVWGCNDFTKEVCNFMKYHNNMYCSL